MCLMSHSRRASRSIPHPRKGERLMYTRLVTFKFKTENRDKVEQTLKDFMPIMKAQAGFTDVVTMIPEAERNEIICVSFWTTKAEALRFQEETFPGLVRLLQ